MEAAREQRFSKTVTDGDQSAFKPARAPRAQARGPADLPSAHSPAQAPYRYTQEAPVVSKKEGQSSLSSSEHGGWYAVTIDDSYTSSAGPTPVPQHETSQLTEEPYRSSAGPTPEVPEDTGDASNDNDDGNGFYRSAAEPDEKFEANIDAIESPNKALRTMGLAAGGFLSKSPSGGSCSLIF